MGEARKIPALSDAIKTALTEGPMSYRTPEPSKFEVTYDVRTPKGSTARFSRSSTLAHTRGAMSETATKSYLQTLHPGTEITIFRLKFS
jgi:hypothetical protein